MLKIDLKNSIIHDAKKKKIESIYKRWMRP